MAPTLGEVGAFAFLVSTTCGSGCGLSVVHIVIINRPLPHAVLTFALSSFLAIIALSAFKTIREESRSDSDDCTIRLVEIADNVRPDRQRDDRVKPAAPGWPGHLLD